MNEIYLHGCLQDIEDSHIIDSVEYSKATIVTKNDSGNDDIILLKFKKFSNKYSNGDIVDLKGSIRSYSKQSEDNKSSVQLYVFTYFDSPDIDEDFTNYVKIDGRVCKVDELRTTKNGKSNYHFILANNIFSNDGGKKINSYIPAVVWGKQAIEMSKKLHVNSTVSIIGSLHSRTYKKTYENGEVEIKTAHELLVKSMEVI